MREYICRKCGISIITDEIDINGSGVKHTICEACDPFMQDKPIMLNNATLRDYFAGLAMQGYIISDNEIKISDDILAVYAYTLADEMLRCREGE
jgi:hypothetical protein